MREAETKVSKLAPSSEGNGDDADSSRSLSTKANVRERRRVIAERNVCLSKEENLWKLDVFLAKLRGRVATLATEAHVALSPAKRLPARRNNLTRALGHRMLRDALLAVRASQFVKLTPEQMKRALETFRTPGQGDLLESVSDVHRLWKLCHDGDPDHFVRLFQNFENNTSLYSEERDNNNDRRTSATDNSGMNTTTMRCLEGRIRPIPDEEDNDNFSGLHVVPSPSACTWGTLRRGGPSLPSQGTEQFLINAASHSPEEKTVMKRTEVRSIQPHRVRSGVNPRDYRHARDELEDNQDNCCYVNVNQQQNATRAEPLKLKYKHSRTLVSPPVGWRKADLARAVARSFRPPKPSLRLDRVFGYAPDLAGPNLALAKVRGRSCVVDAHEKKNNDKISRPRKHRSHCIVYNVAAIAVIHNLASNEQTFFRSHSDDVACIAVDSSGSLGASGQVASSNNCNSQPYACVWRVDDGTELRRFGGDGSIQRLVCAVAFFDDASHLAVVSGDDRHTLFIYDLEQRDAVKPVVTKPCKSGVGPPAVTAAFAAPGWTSRRFGVDHLLVTVGRGHLAFWLVDLPRSGTSRRSTTPPIKRREHADDISRDRSQSSSQERDTEYLCIRRLPTYGRHTPPTATLAAVFAPRDDLVLSAGSDGAVYLWRDYQVVQTFQAHARGTPCRCLVHAEDDRLYTGGADGLVRRWHLDKGKYEHVGTYQPAHPHTHGHIHDEAQRIDNLETTSTRATTAAKIHGKAHSPPPGVAETLKPATCDGRSSLRTINNGAGFATAFADQRRTGNRGVSDLMLDPASVNHIIAGMSFGEIIRIDTSCRQARQETITRGHHATTTDVAAHPDDAALCATVGLDCLLCVWDLDCPPGLAAAMSLPTPGTCVAIRGWIGTRAVKTNGKQHLQQRRLNDRVAVGFTNGGIGVYELRERSVLTETRLVPQVSTQPLAQLRYSPDGSALAVGSHDCLIYILDAASGDCDDQNEASYVLLRKLKGHSSYITSLDWSVDGRVLQTTCGGYEILYWDVIRGAQINSTHDSVESDTKWHKWTLTLGFPVMGIFYADSDGTDVNATNRSPDGKLLLVGDDCGFVSLFNAPAVCRWAAHKRYVGHSSHCGGCQFLADGRRAVTTGGRDCAVLVWRVVDDAVAALSSNSTYSATRTGRGNVGEELVIPPTCRPAWNTGCDLSSSSDILRKPQKLA